MMEILSPKFIQTFFTEVPWNKVDMQQHFDAMKINKEEAESLLSVQNFFDNGTFMVRLDVHEEQNNLMLSFVYRGKIHHHKIILMWYFFKRYSYCLENGGISFPSVATLIEYHARKKTLPLPCILKNEFKHVKPKLTWSDYVEPEVVSKDDLKDDAELAYLADNEFDDMKALLARLRDKMDAVSLASVGTNLKISNFELPEPSEN